MSRWFRYHDDALNDPKVQRLPGDTFKAWVNILCIASKNDGVLPNVAEVAFGLRMNESRAGAIVGELAVAGLLDAVPGGYFQPHNWNGRQFKSDVSTARVQAFRERQSKRKGNVSETPNETPPETEQNRAEQIDSGARAPRLDLDSLFEEFWRKKPGRGDHANPKAPAKKIFIAKVNGGADPLFIIAAAARWAALDQKKIGSEIIPQAMTWLRQDRFNDYDVMTPDTPEALAREAELAARHGYKWDEYKMKFVKGEPDATSNAV